MDLDRDDNAAVIRHSSPSAKGGARPYPSAAPISAMAALGPALDPCCGLRAVSAGMAGLQRFDWAEQIERQ